MSDILGLMIRYGYLVVFGVILLENLGVPLPGIVVLVVGGAFAAVGQLSLPLVVGVAIVAALLGDLVWYELGRWRGRAVLTFLCRLSLNPDTCVGTAERFFLRYGMPTLIFAKFLPGVNTVTPPLLGILRAPPGTFLGYDLAGATLYTVLIVGLGYVVGAEVVPRAQEAASRLGVWVGWSALALLAVYLGCRLCVRLKVRRTLRTAGLSPAQLRSRLEDRETLVVIDVRTPLAVREQPQLIPGALRVGHDEIDRVADALLPEQTIVTYCV